MSEKEPTNDPTIRHIKLPSGRWIEVRRFHETNPERELHICPGCDSGLVQPVAWSQNADDTWKLSLECPNCFRTETDDFTRKQVEKLEDKLDEGLSVMQADLMQLSQANMEYDVDCFIEALDADFILPEDF
jgi:hypothetical protein